MGEISIEHASFTYDGKNRIFHDLTCSIRDGEIFCILGPNGIGKSTLLKSILALQPLCEGRILLNGRDVRRWEPAELARAIAYIPQSTQLTFPYRVLDMIMMGRTPHLNSGWDRPTERDYEKVMEAAQALGLEPYLYRSCTTLSGGQLQLVMLARAIAQEAEFLMLDEPTAHLDFGRTMETLNLILRMKARGVGVILTSHNPDHAFMICDKVALMNGGSFSQVGTPDEVITEENLQAMYRTKLRIIDFEEEKGRKLCVPLRDDFPEMRGRPPFIDKREQERSIQK